MADAASSLEKLALERKEKLKALKAKKTERKEDSEKEVEGYINEFNGILIVLSIGIYNVISSLIFYCLGTVT